MYAVSLLGMLLLRYFGSTSPGSLSRFLIVLRDNLVVFAIPLIESLSHILMRLTLPIMPMVISPHPLVAADVLRTKDDH